MKKSFLRKSFSLCCLFCTCLIGLFGCSTAESADKTSPVTKFSLSHSGMSSWECYTGTISRTEKGALLEFTIAGVQKPLVKELDGSVLDELLSVVNEHKLTKWDGFQGPNPPGICDGSGFSLSISFEDGTGIYASGSNNFPNGYGEVYPKLFQHFADCREELLVREGFIKKEVPPAHLSMVYMDTWLEQENDAGYKRHRRVFLTPEEEQKYPELAKKLAALNEIVAAKPDTAILSVVRADNRVVSLTLYEQPAVDSPEQDCRLSAYNYYTEDGRDLPLGDLGYNKNDLIRMLRNELRGRYGEKAFGDLEGIYQNMLTAPEKLVFSVANEAVIFYWQPGEIADPERGFLQVNYNFQYLSFLPRVIKETPATWASGLVTPMDIYSYVSDPDIEKRMQRMSFNVPAGTELGALYHVHFGFEQEYCYEYYYENSVYSSTQPRMERVYRIKGSDIAGVYYPGAAELPSVDASDYCNFIDGVTDIYPVITDPSALRIPEEAAE